MPTLLPVSELGRSCVFINETVDAPSDFDEGFNPVVPAGDPDGDIDSYYPMMTAMWPVAVTYRQSVADSAELMHRHGGATSLITWERNGEEEIFIALTGGGMDLRFDIAMAYICCGQLPPARLMSDLPSFAGSLSWRQRRVLACAPHVRDALTSMANSIADRANWLLRQASAA
ncbi:hypothetical protein [Falsiroseomonas sp. CW058]|uniref:hypothetical protein n=1 Tax=Falsiroseomonas sp. CW058 TaxID=3388664 RepID=UPI003D30FE82